MLMIFLRRCETLAWSLHVVLGRRNSESSLVRASILWELLHYKDREWDKQSWKFRMFITLWFGCRLRKWMIRCSSRSMKSSLFQSTLILPGHQQVWSAIGLAALGGGSFVDSWEVGVNGLTLFMRVIIFIYSWDHLVLAIFSWLRRWSYHILARVFSSYRFHFCILLISRTIKERT